MDSGTLALISVFIGVLVMGCLIGIVFLVYGLWEKHLWRKWQIAIANDTTLQALIKAHDNAWEAYKAKNKLAGEYQKQIDHLIGNLTYLPSYEVEWRTKQAEEYKIAYFNTKTEATALYEVYCKANDELNEYCEAHKIERLS